jgi:hypothetical protein
LVFVHSTIRRLGIMAKRFFTRISLLLILAFVLLLGGVSVTLAQSESFQVVSVNTLGCNSGNFGMTVLRSNLDGGSYIVRTVVTVGGLVYMNEQASISINGTSGWNIFNNFTYGAVPNPGTYPIPAGQEMRLDFTLERPKGTILYSWVLIVTGCDTGGIIYNGLPVVAGGPVCSTPLPDGSVVGEAPLGAHVYWAPGQESPGIVLNPGTYHVIGQDETETYYKLFFNCQYIWVRKDTMQPSYQSPQNGAPLPQRIVS